MKFTAVIVLSYLGECQSLSSFLYCMMADHLQTSPGTFPCNISQTHHIITASYLEAFSAFRAMTDKCMAFREAT